jgi:soluble lytic murein transglycosylase-like protein
MRNIMGVTVLPYIDQTQTARLQEAASANIQTPKNTDEAVTTFKECLASAERSVQAMAVDALLAASNSGAVSLDTVQQILGFTPQTDAPVDTSPVADTFTSSSSSANTTAANATSSGSVSSPENLEEYFKEASETYGVDINLLKAIARQESNFNPSATSSAGAMGVMQLMPSTAKGLGVTNAYDAQENIMGGAKLMAQNLKKYNGDVSLALAAYNAGSGNVDKYGGIPPFKETQNYVKKVLGYYQNSNA